MSYTAGPYKDCFVASRHYRLSWHLNYYVIGIVYVYSKGHTYEPPHAIPYGTNENENLQ